ncbi:hypothetical protein ULMS_06810 [Patiriisocius marinistellae]|uniref:Transmembrane protein n=1 Tax=Patiriisocius marinistellae TaxID=2494560 RepID=A0A5J4FTZ0_9FLAO|nr:manganese efflux pump [Patiriisocius marinistellae]GEQ85173.1 hypothetical protein ULMS_06810 [Patiriisocius marinistellae]
MNFLLRIAAYIFHPLFMPLLGVGTYFVVTPRYTEPQFMMAKMYAVIIITIFIPLVSYFLLRSLGIVKSIHLSDIAERKYPLMAQCLLILLLMKMVFKPYDDPELYYFFVGILFTTMTALILVFFSFKISLHQMAIAGVTMFIIGLSIHFQINLIYTMAFFFFVNGLVATSRLHTKSHTYPELIGGFFIGVIPQLILFSYWL